MRTSPAFSVVIPTYNQAEYLRVALKSVLVQTFTDFEVVIVNNYSTDHTLQVIQALPDPRVQVIDFRNHGVIGAGRNVGIKASQAPYVAFLDSDDTWYSDKLQRIAEVIKHEPDVGLICHDQDLLRDGQVAAVSCYGAPDDFPGSMYDHLLFVCNPPATSATVVARRYLDEVGYFSDDPGFMTVEDYDLFLKLAKVCHFRFVREILGSHNFHEASASANVELHLRSGLAVLDKHCGDLQKSDRNYPRRVFKRLYASAFFAAARQYQRRGDFKKPLVYYARTLWTYPIHQRAYLGLGLLFADRLLGRARRKRITAAIWGLSWRWG